MIYHCIALGTFPNQLKLAKIIPVYKSGSSVDIQTYRPIFPSFIFSKIFEWVILNRLVYFLEQNSLIDSTQFGVLHNHSTIIDIITESYENIDDKCFLLLSFLILKQQLILCVKTAYLIRN